MAFSARMYSNIILQQHNIITPMQTKVPCIYNSHGFYDDELAIERLEQTVGNLLPNPTRHHVDEVIADIRRQTYRNFKPHDINGNHICLKNGIFNLDTFELEPHTPDKFITYRIPVSYNPDIDSNYWNNYIDSLVKSKDKDKLQESIGNLFANHYATKKLIYAYGPNDSGKSTFFNIIQYFLSKDNYSNLSLNQLGEKFTNAMIYNKRANIYSDIPYRVPIKYYGIIKNFTGGDEVTIQFKHKDAFQFTNVAKMFFTGNGIPIIKDEQVDDAFLRRWEFIPFPYQFEPDNTIIDNFTDDFGLSVILNWALAGYKRLKEQNWLFTNGTTIDEAKCIFAEAAIKNDPLFNWMLDKCCVSKEWITVKELYRDCINWCRKNGHQPPITINVFGERMHNQHFISIADYYPTINGEKIHGYRGIDLK